jgi:PilZ domain
VIKKRKTLSFNQNHHSLPTELQMLTNFSDRRKFDRIPVRTPVTIVFSDAAPLDCVATDVSDGGARLHLRSTELPDVFVLHFAESGKRRHCRVAWRHGPEFGVAFTDLVQAQFGRRVAKR